MAAVLTGERIEVPRRPGWDAGDLLGWLESIGWTSERLADRRFAGQRMGRAWPDPLPPDLADGLEFARYAAILAQVRRTAGLDGLSSRVHRGPAVIGPDEARLLAERPPHHVLH